MITCRFDLQRTHEKSTTDQLVKKCGKPGLPSLAMLHQCLVPRRYCGPRQKSTMRLPSSEHQYQSQLVLQCCIPQDHEQQSQCSRRSSVLTGFVCTVQQQHPKQQIPSAHCQRGSSTHNICICSTQTSTALALADLIVHVAAMSAAEDATTR